MAEIKMALNITETANALGLSRQSIYKLIYNDPSFPVLRIGKSVRISVEGLKEWIKKQQEGRCA